MSKADFKKCQTPPKFSRFYLFSRHSITIFRNFCAEPGLEADGSFEDCVSAGTDIGGITLPSDGRQFLAMMEPTFTSFTFGGRVLLPVLTVTWVGSELWRNEAENCDGISAPVGKAAAVPSNGRAGGFAFGESAVRCRLSIFNVRIWWEMSDGSRFTEFNNSDGVFSLLNNL